MKRHAVFKYIDFIYICAQGWTLEVSGKVWEQKKCRLTFIDVETYRVVGVVYDYLSIRLGLRVLVETTASLGLWLDNRLLKFESQDAYDALVCSE